MSDYAWSVVENIVLLILVALLFWLTRDWLVFLLLLFLNASRPRSK